MTKLKTKVNGLATPTRKGNKVSTSWKIPAKALKSGAKDSVRFDGLDMKWVYDAVPSTGGVTKGKDDIVNSDSTGKEKTKSDSDTISRKSFWPLKNPKLAYIEFWIRGYNKQGGKKVYGPYAHKALQMLVPDPPGTTLSYNSGTGVVTASYSTEHPDGARECYRTKCWVTVGGSKKADGVAYTEASRTVGSWEVPSALNLGIGNFAVCTFRAINQGLAGDSSPSDKTVYVVHPNPATLGTPELVYSESGVNTTAMVRVPISSTGGVKVGTNSNGNAIWQFPTTVTLQRVKDVPTDNDPTSASQMDGWTDVMSDNGSTNGLSDTWAQGVSGVGLHTWYRLKSERDGYTVLSTPVCATAMDVTSSSTVAGAANIDSISAGADGKSLTVTLSGKEQDDDGYEVSWSDEEDAWESTEPPKTFETTGSSLVIKGLKEGTKYYVKARAYDTDADGNHVYGSYSGVRAETPYTMPSAVILLGDSATVRGSALQLSWTYDTEAQQVGWRLIKSDGSVMKSGNETTCACTVTPEEYGDAESLSLCVELTTGGGWKRSDYRTFSFADAPTCSISVPSTLTSQPLSLTVESDVGDIVSASVTAVGHSGSGIGAGSDQMAGDTVWSGSIMPTWSTSGGTRSASITLPRGLGLNNGASYIVRVSSADSSTGLSSETAESAFSVDWSHTASQPSVSVVADIAGRSAAITVSAPADYENGDRFDLYRSTPDGEWLIASDVPFGSTVTDRMAPYTSSGNGLSYVAVAKTADGDTCASDDAEYSISCKSLRFDWEGKFVELPYNLKSSDAFEKDSEVRTHVDGSRSAYWNAAITRNANLSTDVIRLKDDEQQSLVRDMLQHPGSVFVRTPDGLAFSADVSTGSIERSYETKAVGMSFNAFEHDLGDDGRPTESDIAVPEWSGGGVTESGGVVYDEDGGFPMDSWAYIGYADEVLYVFDGDVVRDGTGAEMEGWTWDGTTLLDDDDEPVELDEEA